MINQLNDRVLSVRNFNRFYTNYIGLLDQHMLYDPFSLTEARVLFEIAHTENCTAKLLRDLLAIDRGYVSRILRRMEQLNLITKMKSADDGRISFLYLTDEGKKTLAMLVEKSNVQIEKIMVALPENDQDNLVQAMRTIEKILALDPEESAIHIRSHNREDIDSIVERHQAIYGAEYSFDETF